VEDENHQQLIVLGIPRGGIITGAAVSRKLAAKFEAVCSKRLIAPNNNQITIGAMADHGDLYINKDVVEAMKIPIEYILGG
jgi:putative phosphoribosyl transferase